MKFSLSTAVISAVTAASLGVLPAYANTVAVQPGATLWRIASANHVSVSALQVANPTVDPLNLPVGHVLQLPNQATPSYLRSQSYTVQPGDSIWKIAKRSGVTVNGILSANPSLDPSNLQIGGRVILQAASVSQPAVSTTATKPVQTPTAQPATSSSDNLYWLEHVINAEAGGESLQAQIGVGDVIMHRLQAGSYGTTVHDVVFQISSGHYQFTSVLNGYIYSTPNASSVQAAIDVLQKQQDVVPGALVFYNPAQTPAGSWVWSQPTITQFGNLVFAK